MKYVLWFIADRILEMKDVWDRSIRFFKRTKTEPSLVVNNINWCTRSGWMDRLVAYKQLELWTHDR
jgi:hypothetical protein